MRYQLKRAGMPLFEPQDVSGWSLSNVWTLNRITNTHEFLMDWIKPKLVNSISRPNFKSKDTIRAML